MSFSKILISGLLLVGLMQSHSSAETITGNETEIKLEQKFKELIAQFADGSTTPENCKASYHGLAENRGFQAYGVSHDKTNYHKGHRIYGVYTEMTEQETNAGIQKIQILTLHTAIDSFTYSFKNRRVTIDEAQKEEIKNGEVLYRELFTYYVDANIDMLKSISYTDENPELVTIYSPPIPLCTPDQAIHTAKFNQPISGSNQWNFVHEIKIQHGTLVRNIFDYQKSKLWNKGDLRGSEVIRFDSKTGWKSQWSDVLGNETIIFSNEEFVE